jgi:hypothetical protein
MEWAARKSEKESVDMTLSLVFGYSVFVNQTLKSGGTTNAGGTLDH